MQDNSLKALLEFFSPTRTESIFYCLAGLIIILAAKTATIFNSLTTNIAAGEQIKQFWLSLTDRLNNYSDISGAFFWFLAGAALYLVVWITVVVLIDWYNDILVSTSFTHPKSFHQSDYWAAIVGRFFIRVASGVLLGALVIITIGSLLPSGYTTALNAWSGTNAVSMIWYFIKILLMSFVVQYSATLLLRLMFLRRRLYS